MFAAALRRHTRNDALKDLEQRLLHAFTGDVACDRDVLGLAGDLVDLIDIDDAALGLGDIHIRRLKQVEQDVFDVLAHITGLGDGGSVGNRERHIQQARQRARKERLAATGGTDEQDIALFDLHVCERIRLAASRLVQAFVVVMHRDREHSLGVVVADDVLVEEFLDLSGRRHFKGR